MLNAGDTFAHYTIEAVLGRGGMGSVYRARDAKLQRHVALKVLSGGDADARYLREARAAAALDHPNVITLFEAGEHQGCPYIAMELVEGRTLRDAINDAGAPLATRLGWLADVARALGAAHRRDLVHRDIKPENVMVRSDGAIKVLDFGIARRKRGSADPAGPAQPAALATTESGLLLGTPPYMAPEQIRGGPLDGRSDQFAWGVLAHELLTGRTPWRGGDDPLAVMASVLTDSIDEQTLVDAGVPEAPRRAVLRALRKLPGERFATMDDLLAAFLGAPSAPSPEAPDPRGSQAPEPRSAPSATLAARYSTDEVRAILERAVERQQGQGRFSFDELLAAAREVGIDEATLREASRELRAPPPGDPGAPSYRAWLRRKRRSFLRHLGAFLVVNAVFLLLGLMLRGLPQMLIPGLFWAIGLGIHAVHVYTADEDEWQDILARKERRRERRRPPEPAIEQGATLLLQAGEKRRVAAPPARVRVEADHDASQRRDDEDDEAALALEQQAGGRRGRRR